MTSLQRKLARAKGFRAGSDAEQPTVIYRDGSYKTLHPTRGWQRVSALRAKYFSGYRALGFAGV